MSTAIDFLGLSWMEAKNDEQRKKLQMKKQTVDSGQFFVVSAKAAEIFVKKELDMHNSYE